VVLAIEDLWRALAKVLERVGVEDWTSLAEYLAVKGGVAHALYHSAGSAAEAAGQVIALRSKYLAKHH
jgi:hypothetical protein